VKRFFAISFLVFLVAAAYISPWQTVVMAFSNIKKTTFADRLFMRHLSLDNIRLLLNPTSVMGLTLHYLPIWMKNSIVICVATAVLQATLSVMTGYALARFRFPGASAVSALLVVMMIVPATVLFIPTYIICYKLGLVGILGMVLPLAVSAGTAIMTRQFAKGMAQETLDAAMIDGCGDWQVLRYIGFPLLRSMWLMSFAGTFVGAWGNSIGADIMLRNWDAWIMHQAVMSMLRNNYTIEAGTGRDFGIMALLSLLSMAIPLTVFLLMQKGIVEGIEGLVKE
jgi:ABC-type glycerol-3-phosphate transport system permease component